MEKTNVLILYKHLPYKNAAHGGAIIRFKLIEWLSKRHNIYLCCFANDEEKGHVPELEVYCKKVIAIDARERNTPQIFFREALNLLINTPPLRYVEKMQTELTNLVNQVQFDIIYIDQPYMAPYFENMTVLPKTLTVLYEDDLAFNSMKRNLNYLSIKRDGPAGYILNFIYNSTWRKMLNYQKRIWKKVDLIMTITEEEKNIVDSIEFGMNTYVFRPGVDNVRQPIINESKNLVFVGNFRHHPNVDAALYFIYDILPQITDSEVKLTIVGPAPPKRLKSLASRRINITGFVTDIVPYLENSEIFVCPIRTSGGMRMKVLSAMAAGLPVISTSLGAEGLNGMHDGNELMIADDPHQFATTVEQLLKDKYKRIELATNARKVLLEYYSWEHVLSNLERKWIQMLRTKRQKKT